MARTLGRDEIEGLGAGAIAHRRRPRLHRARSTRAPGRTRAGRSGPTGRTAAVTVILARIAIDPTAGTGSFIPPALAGWSGIARRNDDRLSGSWGRYRKRSQESRGHYRTTHHHPVPFFVDATASQQALLQKVLQRFGRRGAAQDLGSTVAPRSRPIENRIVRSLAASELVGLWHDRDMPDSGGTGSMEPKMLLMLALLAPVLVLAAGVFARRQDTRAETRNGKWAGMWWAHKDSNLGPAD